MEYLPSEDQLNNVVKKIAKIIGTSNPSQLEADELYRLSWFFRKWAEGFEAYGRAIEEALTASSRLSEKNAEASAFWSGALKDAIEDDEDFPLEEKETY